MGASMLTFIAEHELQRAVIVLDIALARGCQYGRALAYAVESLDQADCGFNAGKIIERRWRDRDRNAATGL